jgi:hypothetical protein
MAERRRGMLVTGTRGTGRHGGGTLPLGVGSRCRARRVYAKARGGAGPYLPTAQQALEEAAPDEGVGRLDRVQRVERHAEHDPCGEAGGERAGPAEGGRRRGEDQEAMPQGVGLDRPVLDHPGPYGYWQASHGLRSLACKLKKHAKLASPPSPQATGPHGSPQGGAGLSCRLNSRARARPSSPSLPVRRATGDQYRKLAGS